MKALKLFEAFAPSLVGLPITHVWRGYGSAIFIECGTLRQVKKRDGSLGHPEGEVSLGVEWSWRIENRKEILCGSWSEEALWEPALNALRNARISRCDLFGYLPEIAITMDNGNRFLSFSTAEGQPQWYLADRREDKQSWFSVRAGQLHLGDGSEPAS